MKNIIVEFFGASGTGKSTFYNSIKEDSNGNFEYNLVFKENVRISKLDYLTTVIILFSSSYMFKMIFRYLFSKRSCKTKVLRLYNLVKTLSLLKKVDAINIVNTMFIIDEGII